MIVVSAAGGLRKGGGEVGGIVDASGVTEMVDRLVICVLLCILIRRVCIVALLHEQVNITLLTYLFTGDQDLELFLLQDENRLNIQY